MQPSFSFLMRDSSTHLDFDLELAKQQSQENPVYYVQYVHASDCQPPACGGFAGHCLSPSESGRRSMLLEDPDELALIRKVVGVSSGDCRRVPWNWSRIEWPTIFVSWRAWCIPFITSTGFLPPAPDSERSSAAISPDSVAPSSPDGLRYDDAGPDRVPG
jgi:arginyl-tRNA synthetase